MQKIIIKNINLYICNVEFKLIFDDQLTLISGKSGSRKSLMYKAFRDKSAEDERIICFDGIDLIKKDITKEISKLKNKVIVIDNADILNMDQRADIALDENNQYIIISNIYGDGYCPGRNSLRKLVGENNKGKLIPVLW